LAQAYREAAKITDLSLKSSGAELDLMAERMVRSTRHAH
jgi:hypothetical protein